MSPTIYWDNQHWAIFLNTKATFTLPTTGLSIEFTSDARTGCISYRVERKLGS